MYNSYSNIYVTTQTIYTDINNNVSIIYREGENLFF